MSTFFEHIAAAKESGAGVFLRTLQWGVHRGMTLVIAVHPLQNAAHGVLAANPSQVWNIEVHGIVAYDLTASELFRPELLDDHPLLWGTNRRPRLLHIHGAVYDPLALLGRLYAIHVGLTQELIPFLTYFNARDLTSLQALLEGGRGVLAEGPEHVLQAYQVAVVAQGSEAWITGTGIGDELDDETYRRYCADKVLLLDTPQGESYIIADQFTFTRIS